MKRASPERSGHTDGGGCRRVGLKGSHFLKSLTFHGTTLSVDSIEQRNDALTKGVMSVTRSVTARSGSRGHPPRSQVKSGH
jgi:hypothetical protein